MDVHVTLFFFMLDLSATVAVNALRYLSLAAGLKRKEPGIPTDKMDKANPRSAQRHGQPTFPRLFAFSDSECDSYRAGLHARALTRPSSKTKQLVCKPAANAPL